MRAWWSGTLSHFRRSNPGTIVGALSTRTVETNVTNRDAQLVAWRRQIEVLSEATAGFPPDDRLLLEYPLLRLGRRIDAVLVTKTAILVLEFRSAPRSSPRAIDDKSKTTHSIYRIFIPGAWAIRSSPS